MASSVIPVLGLALHGENTLKIIIHSSKRCFIEEEVWSSGFVTVIIVTEPTVTEKSVTEKTLTEVNVAKLLQFERKGDGLFFYLSTAVDGTRLCSSRFYSATTPDSRLFLWTSAKLYIHHRTQNIRGNLFHPNSFFFLGQKSRDLAISSLLYASVSCQTFLG